ncbi:S-adenosyl methyltransferase [Asanoa hainanensis]|uniref:S-adenosyl methyltransferase n=1 Tax=Asanoa hainanensis TaxID=560556 RepID=A0A239PH15_9ACTN|nr:SAM-dependent methyltransferase [Asanoa hainanensis]SNT66262.1 S-adenosyl methyltransferase [Asanoa hainanensis]
MTLTPPSDPSTPESLPADTAATPASTGDRSQRPATAARIYDYFLGGVTHFPADRAAALAIANAWPDVPAVARANRAWLGRVIRYLVDAGVRQFLDIGSGIPTEGNVHEVAQQVDSKARVLYVDIDPVAVSESLDLLRGNEYATAVRGDLRSPDGILDAARRHLYFDQPVGLVLAAVLHFLPDDQAHAAVRRLVAALPPGSFVAISHGAAEVFQPTLSASVAVGDVYAQQTATPAKARTRLEVHDFLTGLTLIEPGVVGITHWHPDATPPAAAPGEGICPGGEWGAVAQTGGAR